MDKNDLKSLWLDFHNENQQNLYTDKSIEEIIKLKHCKMITKVLTDQKLKILLYLLFLAVYIGLMLYAFVYLGLHLSIISKIPLFLAGLFILMKTTSEIVRFIIVTKTADNMSINKSNYFIRKKLNGIRTFDFLSYLVFFYMLAIGTSFIYLKDIGGIKFLNSGNEVQPFIITLILLLLITPWLIKYQHNQRYKKIYSSLKDAAKFLNDAS